MNRGSLLLSSLIAGFLVGAAPVFAAEPPRRGIGEQKALIILARFPDVQPSISREKLHEKYFDKLARYLKAVSYEKAWLKGKMTDSYTLPHNVSHYRLSPRNLAVDKSRVVALIQDAIDLADAKEDFSQYSMLFISLGAGRKDYGMMGLCGYPGMLGWQRTLPLRTRTKGQAIPGGVAIYCENAHVGVVFHDMAHIMAGVEEGKRGLPCLYDHDLQAQQGPFRNQYKFYLTNVGFFDPMSCHFYKLGQGPPGPCAWTKLRLNWIAPEKLATVPRGQSRKLLLGPLSSPRSRTQAIRLPLERHTYYLIENRQSLGPDRNLPGHGLLVYYCDDEVAECRHGRSPVKLVNANPDVPELRGAPFALKGKANYSDKKRGVSIQILAQRGMAYEIQVSNGR